MIITGTITSAEIFTDNIEESALNWVTSLCNHPAMSGIAIVQMPDVHAGNSCNVGTAYPIGAYVNPDHVGVDIGCTISMHKLSATVYPDDYALMDHRIREVHRKKQQILIEAQTENWNRHSSLERGNPVKKFYGPL